MTNSNNLIYLCKEVFDENSEPTQIGKQIIVFRIDKRNIHSFNTTNIRYIQYSMKVCNN